MSVGLIRQYHYVGLDKMCDYSVEQTTHIAQTDTVANTESHDTETADDALDDAVIAEGDEHRIQISGAPMASMMCVENPEHFREIICVAPAEGQKPLNIMTDSNFEAMSNPDKFPFGVGTQRRCDSTARTLMNLFMRYSRVHFRHYRKSATVSRHSLFEAIFQWDCVYLP